MELNLFPIPYFRLNFQTRFPITYFIFASSYTGSSSLPEGGKISN